MKHSESNYPIGATWKCTDKYGMEGTIWLAERSNSFEVWRWSSCYSDGSGREFDWGTSYQSCKNQINVYGRFKRVKS